MTRLGSSAGAAVAAMLALASAGVAAEPPPLPSGPETVAFEGLRGRLGDGKAKKARLVFTEDAVTVEVEGESPERFAFDSLILQRGRHYRALPLLDRAFWAKTLLPLPVYLVGGGLDAAVVSVSAGIATAHILHFARRRSRHWLSLHASQRQHRWAFLLLPRSSEKRIAISEEFVRRDQKELLVRPPLPGSLRSRPPYPYIGKPAPDFALAASDGTTVRLSELRGTVVLLNFWATWCGPCRKEMPHLEQLQRDYRSDGLTVLAVSAESLDLTRKHLQERGIALRSLHDADGTVFRRYHIAAIPVSLVIGRNGLIERRLVGAQSLAALTKAVRPHISGAGLRRRP